MPSQSANSDAESCYSDGDGSDAVDAKKHKFSPKAFEIWILGITIVIGGQYFGWNAMLVAGFGSACVSTLLIGTAYICLILCVSELTSALPFAGGAYGLARCTIGFYFGCVIGYCEAFEYILYVASSSLTLGSMICNLLNLGEKFQPMVWFLFYISALAIHINGGLGFWRFSLILGVGSLFILLLYCFSCLSIVNFNDFAETRLSGSVQGSGEMFVGNFQLFLHVFPLSCWFFVGVESLVFFCDVVEEPRRQIPLAAISCVMTLFSTAIFVLFVCSSSPPGVATIAESLSPMDYGFSKVFGIPLQYTIVFAIPATYATAFGFMFSFGKLMQSLAQSRLLPEIFTVITKANKVPYVALSIGTVICYGITLLAFVAPYVGLQLFNISIMCAFTAYIAQCYGYIVFKLKFSSIERKFKSPLGIFGAVYAMLVYSLGLVSVIGFQNDSQFALIAYALICLLGTVYYFLHVKDSQSFSPDEEKIMFRAHIIVHSTRKKKRLQKPSSSANVSSDLQGSSVRSKHSKPIARVESRGKSSASIHSEAANVADESVSDPYSYRLALNAPDTAEDILRSEDSISSPQVAQVGVEGLIEMNPSGPNESPSNDIEETVTMTYDEKHIG